MSLPAFHELPAPPPARRGLLLLLDIFAAPKRAFATIEATREWIPAFAVVAALGIAGSLLQAPAIQHLIAVTAPGATGAPLGPADVNRAAGSAVADQIVWQTMGALMLWIWTAVIAAAITKRGPQSFGIFFSLAANCAVPAAIGFFAAAVAVSVHPHGFSSIAELNRALPDNLAVFEPQDNDRAVSFLASFDVFQLWSTLLLAFGLRALGKLELFWALIVAFGLLLAFVLFQFFTGA